MRTVQSYSPCGTNVPSWEGTLVPPGKYDWTCASFSPLKSTTEMANQLVKQFLHCWWQCCLAHWRHLANTIELLLPSAHPSPQPKWQSDRFSHYCTAHCRQSLHFTMCAPFPKKCPFQWGDLDPILYMIAWAQPSPQPKWHLDRFSRFCSVSLYLTMGRPFLPQNCPFSWEDLDLYLIRSSLAHLSPQPKRHLDWFSRFAGLTNVTDRRTDRPLLGR